MVHNPAACRFLVYLLAACAGLLTNINGRENPINLQSGAGRGEDSQKDIVIRVGVEEVRLDAAVVDKKGRQVTDLTADDFEVYQDGIQQKVTSAFYMAENWIRPPGPTPSDGRAKDSAEPPLPMPAPLSKEDVHRTIVFLVDDLSMSFPDLNNAREALRKFVEIQMQPGDLVSIMQTKGSTAGLMTFASSKRELFARINRMRWSTLSGSDPRYGIGIPQGLATSYIIRALQQMPGRKMLILLTASVMYNATALGDRTFDQLADMALRAGVVIHTLDILGLTNNQYTLINYIDRDGQIRSKPRPMDAEEPPPPKTDPENPSDAAQIKNESMIRENFGPTSAESRLAQSLLRDASMGVRRIPLSEKTGGLFLTGNNFFVKGIGDLEEEIKGYYLISYIPPPDTFKKNGYEIYHKVRIKVKRAGCDIHTRDGFYGHPGGDANPGANDSLTEAMFSPFRHSGLALRLASGYIHDPANRYLLRVWLHLDGRNLAIVDEKNGSQSISLDAAAATSDITGLVQDFGKTHIRLPVSEKEIRWIRENGMKFSLTLPAKKPGAYYVRVAVKDNASNAIGSGYQFIEMPDLSKSRMSLSSIFVLNRDEDASWIESGETGAARGQANRSREAARRSPALRIYQPGEDLDYMAIIYNAPARDGLPPDLESQSILFHNGVEIYRSKPEAINLRRVDDLTRIPVKQRLKLQGSLQPGDYVLQLQITDRRKLEKTPAAQVLDFEIAEQPFNTAGSRNLSALEDSENARKAVVEMSPEELRRLYRRQLNYVKFDPNQDPLTPLLKKVGENVVSFLRDFSSTVSKEQVDMGRSPTRGFRDVFLSTRHEEYQYMILPGSGEDGESWIEDRSDKLSRPVELKTIPGFIVSSGFAAYCMYLHPSHQANETFRYLGREKLKPHAHVIAFSQKIESPDYRARYYDGATSTMVRFLVDGFIWVDPESCQIIRIYTNMLYPERKTFLRAAKADVKYAKVRFDNSPRDFWLPKEVYVAWEFADVTYASWHSYSDYHRFSVASDFKISEPKIGD